MKVKNYRAAVLVSAGTIEIQERSMPTPEPVEAIVRVQYAGVCGTDISLFSGDYSVPLPLVLGHEFVGEVVEVGDKAAEVWLGKRVTAEINNTCRAYRRQTACPACGKGLTNHCTLRTVVGIINYDGAYAEYIRVPIDNLHLLPDSLSWEEGVFIEPLAAAIQTFVITPLIPSAKVVVLGVGRLGLLICGVAEAYGAEVCAIARTPSRLERACSWGASSTVDANQEHWPEAVRDWTGGLGADIVVEATGSPEGLHMASKLVRPRGVIAAKTTCGIPVNNVDLTKLVVDEVQIHTSRCGPFSKAIGMLVRHRLPVASLVSGIFSLEESSQALETAKRTTKALIQPHRLTG